MDATPENVLFLQAVIEHLDELQAALGADWSAFRDRLRAILDRLEGSASEPEANAEVEQFIEMALESPAASLVRALLNQAATASVGADTAKALEVVPFRDHVPGSGGTAARPVVPPGFGRDAVAAQAEVLAAWLPGPDQQGFVEVPIFFSTDRNRTGHAAPGRFYGGGRGSLEFGVASVSIPADHRMGALEQPSWRRFQFRNDPSQFVVVVNIQPMERPAFIERLRGHLQVVRAADVLVFVHGYNVTFADAARRAAQITYDLGFAGGAALFSWPSEASPWPWEYTVDEANVAWAAADFRKFAELLRTEVGARTVSVIAHSMGNRALVDLLKAAATTPGRAEAAALGQVVLAAPDIDAQTFRDLARDFAGVAERLTLYASARDRALLASKVVHGYPRAGDAGQNLVIVDGIDTIDATAVDTGLLGHSYYGDNRSLLTDLFALLRDGEPPDLRFGLRPRSLAGTRYWLFQP